MTHRALMHCLRLSLATVFALIQIPYHNSRCPWKNTNLITWILFCCAWKGTYFKAFPEMCMKVLSCNFDSFWFVPLVYLLANTLKKNDFWLWAYLMKVIQETCPVRHSRYLCFYFWHSWCMRQLTTCYFEYVDFSKQNKQQ